MGILYKHCFGRLRLLRSLDVEENPGRLHAGRVVLCTPTSGACIRYCRICLLWPEVEMFFLSETLVASRCHIFEFMVRGFGRPDQLLRGVVDRFREFAVYVRDGFSAYRQRGYECGCCEVIVVNICSISHDFYVFGVYRNLVLCDKIFYCLSTAMANMQSMNRKAPYLLVDDVNAWVLND